MKTTFLSILSLVSLATMAGCAAQNIDGSESSTSDIVGVTDLNDLESALGLEKDEQLESGEWSRGDDRLQAGECWKSRFASSEYEPSEWEFRRYKNGASFFRKLGAGPLDGDARAVGCVDVDTKRGGQPYTYSLEGLALDVAFRSKLGKLQSLEGGAGHSYLGFDRLAVEVQDANHFCGLSELTGHETSLDPALKAGTDARNECGSDSQECRQKSNDACVAAFATDAKGDGTIDRPAFGGTRFLNVQDKSISPSVAAFAYRFATKRSQGASMAADPIGTFKELRKTGSDDVTVFEKAEVHHVTDGTSEALYLTHLNVVSGDLTPQSFARCKRSIANGVPTTAYACKGL